MVIGLLPIVGGIYDVVSLALERDLISGRPLTTVDRAIMSAGLLFSTLGFVDEALEGGSRLLRHLDEVEAAGVGRGLRHLDEFTAGDRALLRGDELRRALGGFEEGGGALARRLDAVAVRQAVVPYDIRTAARQYNFPDRVTNAIVENLKPGRYIPIELKDLGGGRLAMKPAAMHLDNLAPYKHIDLKAKQSDGLGFLKDEVTGEDYITDPDIMLVIDNGRILSDAATVKLADEMNFFARGGREVDPRVARKRGPLVVDPRDPFQHSGRATFFTVQGAGKYRHIADAPPKYGVAVFTLDPRGRPIVYEVKGKDYLNWVRETAYNEDLRYYPWASANPGGDPNLDWASWYLRRPYFRGTERPWTKGATSNSTYTQFDPLTGRPKQTALYDASGRVILHINWKREGRMPPGHFHYFPVPGDPSTGHGRGARHYAPFEPEDWGLPANWNIWP
jgi:hypothetical protein